MALAFVVLTILPILQINASINKNLGHFKIKSTIGTLPKRYPITLDDLNITRTSFSILCQQQQTINSYIGPILNFDPFEKAWLKPLKFKKIFSLESQVNLWNLRVVGIKKFKLNSIKIYFKNHRTEFHLSIPKVVINVDFITSMKFTFIPIVMEGHLKATLSDVRIHGELGAEQLMINDVEVFQLTSASVYTQARNLHVHIEGLSNIASLSINEIWTSSKDEIALFALQEVLEAINNVLKPYTVIYLRNCFSAGNNCLKLLSFILFFIGVVFK